MVDVNVPGAKSPLRCFVVYPEIKDRAPVVIVIHEIYGASDWFRAVADQLAAEGSSLSRPTCSQEKAERRRDRGNRQP